MATSRSVRHAGRSTTRDLPFDRGWEVTCQVDDGLPVECEITGEPAWGVPLEHTCDSRHPHTGLPGGHGTWRCDAWVDEEPDIGVNQTQ